MTKNKKTFNFSIDRKVSIWRKELYSIEANSYEEALEEMKDEMENPVYDERWFYSNDFDYETEEQLRPSDNDWYATIELTDLNGDFPNVVATDVDRLIQR